MTNLNGIKIAPRVLNMLALHDYEEIRFFMKIGTNPFIRNEQKEARVLWLGTQERLIFLDYYRFPITPANASITLAKDVLPYSEIKDITAQKKTFSLSPKPLISMRTASENYAVVFYTEKSCKNKFQELQKIIKDLNPKTEFKDEI